MYQFTIASVGSLEKPYWQEAAAYYQKLLKPFAAVKTHVIASQSFTVSSMAQSRDAECHKMADFLAKQSGFVIRLDEAGTTYTSQSFARLLKTHEHEPIVFAVAGPLGWNQEMKQSDYATLSLSPLTMPHEMAQVVLMEQLYREP